MSLNRHNIRKSNARSTEGATKKVKAMKMKSKERAARSTFDSEHKSTRGNITKMALEEYYAECCTEEYYAECCTEEYYAECCTAG